MKTCYSDTVIFSFTKRRSIMIVFWEIILLKRTFNKAFCSLVSWISLFIPFRKREIQHFLKNSKICSFIKSHLNKYIRLFTCRMKTRVTADVIKANLQCLTKTKANVQFYLNKLLLGQIMRKISLSLCGCHFKTIYLKKDFYIFI